MPGIKFACKPIFMPVSALGEGLGFWPARPVKKMLPVNSNEL